jgi:hypothetical protein
MTNQQIIDWLKTNIGADVQRAIADTNEQLFTPEIMIGMAMRETGLLIMNLINAGLNPPGIWERIKGDYSQRPGETIKQFHGFGLWQIDKHSFPDFVNSGNWSDPYKCCKQAISILNNNRAYLQAKFGTVTVNQVIASYNCGEGNESRVIASQQDVDSRTFNHDYSKSVIEFSYMV